MIGRISGRLDWRGPDHVLIDVRGVGYIVHVSDRTLSAMPGLGEAVSLYTDLLVREDLLQLFGSSKKTGALYIETLEAFGKIYLKDGDIVHAEIESSDGSLLPLPNMKALHRILTWKGGLFELGQGESPVGIEPINEGVNGLLMEAFRQKDELSQLNARLPDMTAKLGLNLKLTKAFKDLSPTALDMLQAVLTTTSVQEAIDACVLLDLESCQELVALLEAGYIEIN